MSTLLCWLKSCANSLDWSLKEIRSQTVSWLSSRRRWSFKPITTLRKTTNTTPATPATIAIIALSDKSSTSDVSIGVAGLLVVVSTERIQGASLLSSQYTADASIFDVQQWSAAVLLMLTQSLSPQKSHTSGQQMVPISFSIPARPFEQLNGIPSASNRNVEHAYRVTDGGIFNRNGI